MRRSLRKGITTVGFQHTNTSHNICVKLCESEVENGTATLSFSMRPVDSNQRDDEKYLHEDKLLYVTISDKRIIDGFANHIEQGVIETKKYKLEILSQGKKLTYETKLESKLIGNLEILKLSIIND